MNTPPFHVGQKVVCIKTSERGTVIKDSHYTCAGCYKCKYCGKWRMAIKEFPSIHQGSSCSPGCAAPIEDVGFYYINCFASYFAPITESYADIRAEIAAGCKETIESPDKVIIREPVNN